MLNRAPTPAGRAALGLALLTALLFACDRRVSSPPSSQAQDGYRRPERLIAALGLRPGDAVAEVGAGGGYLTGRLAAAVGASGRIVATDIDAEALSALRKRTAAAPTAAGHVEVRRVAADDPGLAPDRFELIFLSQVDHLLPDRTAYLRALRPSLKPSGRIAVSNGERHAQAVRRAAAEAGFSVEEIAAELPGQFLFVLRPTR
jgi:predicted methyltransferase